MQSRWSNKDTIIRELRRRSDAGLGIHTTAIKRSVPGLVNAMCAHFGSFADALRAAGIDPASVRLVHKPWDKAAVIAALNDRRAKGMDLNAGAVSKSHAGLYQASLKWFTSYDEALRAAGVDPATVRQVIVWGQDLVIAKLRERRAGGLGVNMQALSNSDLRLRDAMTRHFGSFDAALRAAGIDPADVRKRISWDKDKVIRALHDRRDRGLGLNQKAIGGSDSPLVNAMWAQFGSHDAALRAAGIDPNSVKKRGYPWDRARVLRALQDRQARGLRLDERSVKRSCVGLGDAIALHFPSHDAALRDAGLDPDVARRTPAWSPATIITALLARRDRGLRLHRRAVAQSYPEIMRAIRTSFGSYDAALRAAGIEPELPRTRGPLWDQDRVLAALRSVAKDGEISPKLVLGGVRGLGRAAVKGFGSLEAAARAAGLKFARSQSSRGHRAAGHWTDELVLRTLQQLHRDGHDLRYRHMKEHNHPLFFAAKDSFGSYVNAVKQAGISYWEMSQAQLAKDRAAARNATETSSRRPCDAHGP